jgi:hypothetical protein
MGAVGLGMMRRSMIRRSGTPPELVRDRLRLGYRVMGALRGAKWPVVRKRATHPRASTANRRAQMDGEREA